MTSVRRRPLPVSVIVPTRNAAEWIVDCLTAIKANRPGEIILVDGHSTDATVVLAEPLVTKVLRDDGRGPAAARNIGADAATKTWLAFVDADIVLPEDALERLLAEARERSVDGLQAGLRSSGSDYWSEQLAWHHNMGRSRSWFGVSVTLLRSRVFRRHRFDDRLGSGEDVDYRLQLAAAGVPTGVSDSTIVDHRFAPGFAAARSQWTADGAGLARIVRKYGRPGLRQLAVPFGAAAYWILRSLRTPRRLPYFVGFAIGNWVGALRGLGDRRVGHTAPDGRRATIVAWAALLLGAVAVVAALAALVVLLVAILLALPQMIMTAPWVPVVAAGSVVALIGLQLADTLPADSPTRKRVARYRRPVRLLVVLTVVVTALRLLGTLRLLE